MDLIAGSADPGRDGVWAHPQRGRGFARVQMPLLRGGGEPSLLRRRQGANRRQGLRNGRPLKKT